MSLLQQLPPARHGAAAGRRGQLGRAEAVDIAHSLDGDVGVAAKRADVAAGDRAGADEPEPHRALSSAGTRNWYCTPPLDDSSVQIIQLGPDRNGGQVTETPRDTSRSLTSARSSTSKAMCSTRAAESPSRAARPSCVRASISSTLASPHG